MAGTRYVSPTGRIARPPSRPRFFAPRLLLVTTTVAVLIATNPANDAPGWVGRMRDRIEGVRGGHSEPTGGGGGAVGGGGGGRTRRTSRDWWWDGAVLDPLLDAVESLSSRLTGRVPPPPTTKAKRRWGEVDTNYVLFSLRREYDGVTVGALSDRFRLCEYDGEGGALCEWIADNLCHGTGAFDPRTRPFTAHRVAEALVLSSSVLRWCSVRGHWGCPASWDRFAYNHPLAAPLSVLSDPSVMSDLLALNVLVYPALVTMERLMVRGGGGGSDGGAYYLSCALLLVGLGGLSNLAASALTGRDVSGMRGSVSASLGYQLAVSPSRVLVAFAGVRVTPSDVLLMTSAAGLASLVLGEGAGLGRWSSGSLAAWVIGGVLGNLMGGRHLERYGPFWLPFL